MKKLRYKQGQKVVVGKMEPPLPFNQKVKEKDVVEIIYLCDNGTKDRHYTVKSVDGFIWWLEDKEINHKATKALA